MTRDKYLRTDHWNALRAERRKIAKGCCEICGKATTRMEGHHLIYRVPLTACTVNDIQMLCVKCHVELHRVRNRARTAEGRAKMQAEAEKIEGRNRRRLGIKDMARPFVNKPSAETLDMLIRSLTLLRETMYPENF